MLKIYNTLSRQLEPFVPLRAGEARMYVCGMTVYDLCHIGHGRMMVAFDVVRRWLRASGLKVTYVRNITDIDDKIIRRAAENGEAIGALTERYIRIMDEDVGALGVEKPDHEPRATQYVEQMIAMIRKLEDNGLAYQAADGDVNYPVRKFEGYGKLSGKSLDDLRAGERVAAVAAKHDPLDFVLWKRSKPGEPTWPSPWGAGRPGWAIECSAMGCSLLGETFDIHGGGQDLQFPHHENEIAQSEGANRKPFVKYWLHNGFVQMDEEKMSKSLGNFFTIRDVLARYDAEVVRFFLLRAHYRSPVGYSDVHMEDAKGALTRLYTALKGTPTAAVAPDWNEAHGRRFREAMDEDFGTPEAVAVLFELAGEANRGNASAARQLRALGGVLGLLQRDADAFLKAGPGGGISDSQIDELIAARIAARKSKNFAEADRIRKQLLDAGVVLEDGAAGTTWRRA
jgi:cysteinyl-tRNA synthetase